MSSTRSLLRRRWAVVGLVVAMLTVALLAVLLLTRDRDGLGEARSQSAVRSVHVDGAGTVDLTLQPSADRAAVRAALDALPDDTDDVVVRVGRTELELERPGGGRTRDELFDLLLAVAAMRGPATSIEISPRAGIEVAVPTRPDAAPVALEIAGRVARDGVRPAVNVLRVEALEPKASLTAPVSIEIATDDGDPSASRAGLRALSTLEDRRPRLSSNGRGLELRLQAETLDDAGTAWREARSALDQADAPLDDVSIYVDLVGDAGRARPVLGGSSAVRPDRALTLLRALERDGSRSYVAADLSYAQARANSAKTAAQLTRSADSAAVKRFAVSWQTIYGEQAWMAGTAGEGRTLTEIEDEPSVILDLLPGIAAARAAGLPAVHWDQGRADGLASLRFARPSWVRDGADLADDSTTLRRLARAIRSISWPGAAAFQVILGPGNCDGSRAAAVASVVSTSTGRARSVKAGAACTDDDAADAVREAWSATAD